MKDLLGESEEEEEKPASEFSDDSLKPKPKI